MNIETLSELHQRLFALQRYQRHFRFEAPLSDCGGIFLSLLLQNPGDIFASQSRAVTYLAVLPATSTSLNHSKEVIEGAYDLYEYFDKNVQPGEMGALAPKAEIISRSDRITSTRGWLV